jgi:hypothetical protein
MPSRRYAGFYTRVTRILEAEDFNRERPEPYEQKRIRVKMKAVKANIRGKLRIAGFVPADG